MSSKYLNDTGLDYFWGKIKAWCNATFAAIAHTHTSYAVKHSYTTAANQAKAWLRIANANTHQMDTSKPLHVQFLLTAWNPDQPADYYEQWFVNCEVFGRTSGLQVFGNSTAPFSQIRVLYENTVADIDTNDRPAIDIYLNYALATACHVEIQEVYNSGWTFLVNGVLAASTVPTGFENRAVGIQGSGIHQATYANYGTYTTLQRSNITANITLADNDTYRMRVLNCTNTITVTVPSLNSAYAWFLIKNFNAVSTNKNVTIHPSTTSVLIDDSNADIILKPGEWVIIASKAANSYTLIGDGRYKTQYGISKDNSTDSANDLYLPLGGTKQVYYTTTNGSTTLTNVPAAVNTTLESYTIRHLSTSDWVVHQILHNSNGLYYRTGSNSNWGAWKTFAFTDSNITGNAATASAVAWSGITNKPTTISGYGITDAKIANGTITLGSNSITPLTSVPSHNQASNTITAMTGYSKPSSASAISTSDTLNQAIGKLEKSIDDADISNVVHRTGAESIAGVKTFTDILHATTSDTGLNSSAIRIHCDALDVASLPSSNKFSNIHFLDANGIQLGRLLLYKNADGQTGMSIAVKQHNSSSDQDSYDATLAVVITSDGSGFAFCPTPAANSNDTKIATTEWVNSKGYITSSSSITGNAAGLSSASLGSNYEMTPADFDNRGIGIWKADFKANTTSAPRYNDGDFAIMKLYNTTGTSYAQFLCMSPRRDALYFGHFWNGTWQKWNEVFSSSQHIRLNEGNTILRTVDTDAVYICGGTSIDSSAHLSLRGKSKSTSAGTFDLVAQINSTQKSLYGTSTGTLQWNGQNVQVSSDERLKTPLSNVPDSILDAWGDVEWGQFQYLEAVKEKGENARLHLGMIAQKVKKAFEAKELDACKYGILCHEERPEVNEERKIVDCREYTDEDGVFHPEEYHVEKHHEDAVDLWMVRYAEALCMEAAYQRRENVRLRARLASLEDRLAALELRLGSE